MLIRTFTGAQMVDWLMVVEQFYSREEAVQCGNGMFSCKKIAHCHHESVKTILDNDDEPYVFVSK